MTEAKGVKIAWVACSFSTNGIPDTKHQVLHCYEDKATLLSTIRGLEGARRDRRVVVTPHWGIEYNHTPEAQEKGLAHEMLDAGALVVLGGHPHVVQPWEKYTTHDGREGFVIYSLGNFVSGQSGTDKRSSLILYVGLTKGSDGKVTVNGVRHMPLTMGSSPYTAQLGDRRQPRAHDEDPRQLEQARRRTSRSSRTPNAPERGLFALAQVVSEPFVHPAHALEEERFARLDHHALRRDEAGSSANSPSANLRSA